MKTKAKLSTLALSAAEREERLGYLVNLFRLSYRTHKSYDDTLTDQGMRADDFYDERVNFALGSPAGFDDDEGMEDFRADFQKLGAEDKFIQCCIDYYEDVLDELKMLNHNTQGKLSALMTKFVKSQKKMRNQTERQMLAEREALQNRLEDNFTEQTAVTEKLTALRQELGRLAPAKTKD